MQGGEEVIRHHAKPTIHTLLSMNKTPLAFKFCTDTAARSFNTASSAFTKSPFFLFCCSSFLSLPPRSQNAWRMAKKSERMGDGPLASAFIFYTDTAAARSFHTVASARGWEGLIVEQVGGFTYVAWFGGAGSWSWCLIASSPPIPFIGNFARYEHLRVCICIYVQGQYKI